jgi:hypothetical protein
VTAALQALLFAKSRTFGTADEQITLGAGVGIGGHVDAGWDGTDESGMPASYHFDAGVGLGPYLRFGYRSKDPLGAVLRSAGIDVPGGNVTNRTSLAATNALLDATDAVQEYANDYLGLPLPGNSPGPSEEDQKKNQAAFVAKRDKELADIEKSKDQIMKEQGAQAYYHARTLASLPPQVRGLIEAGSAQ